MTKRVRNIIGCTLLVILTAIAIAIVLNRQWIYDFWRGRTYVASAEMSDIRTSLGLTGQGEFLFNASQPELSTREDFNERCRKEGDEIAILGCYTEGNIYVYNITDAELDGIREVTAAHELLHAAFARMSDDEKSALRPYLDQVYKDNEQILSEDLANYNAAEEFEELYVRAGTEVKDLPAALESHYAKIFKDQDLVVGFYEKYIIVFRELKAELEALEDEMASLTEQIEQKTIEYENRIEGLNASIISFNSCAEVAGCFVSEADFYARRNVLVGEQNALERMYEEINGLIDEYNAKVEIYNADVLRSERLNTIINSSNKPQEIGE